MNAKHLGSDFDDFLHEEGLLDGAEAVASTRVMADRSSQAAKDQLPTGSTHTPRLTGSPCWAQALGDCGGGKSKEHLVSRGLLRSEPVTVSGLEWCREPRTVPV